MSQRLKPPRSEWCVERQLGRYSIYEQGNSRTMTVSTHVDFKTNDRVVAMQGYLSGAPLYLRLVERTCPLSMAGAPPAVKDGIIDEQLCDVVKIRAQSGGTRTVTVPTETDPILYGEKTEPMVLTGKENDVTFLKIIPEQIWDDEDRVGFFSDSPRATPA